MVNIKLLLEFRYKKRSFYKFIDWNDVRLDEIDV